MFKLTQLKQDFRGFRRRSAIRSRAAFCRPGLIERRNRLIIAPHPDDETFGTGGLIAQASAPGDGSQGDCTVDVVFLTSGEGSHRGCCAIVPSQLAARREAEALSATRLLGVASERVHFLRWEDGKLPHPGQEGFPKAQASLARLIASVAPAQIFVTHPMEGWSDHLAASELAEAAIQANGSRVELYHYCVWLYYSLPLARVPSLRWRDCVRLDIRNQLSAKRAAIRSYLEDRAPCGSAYCGILPRPFLKAFEWEYELYFRAGD